MNNHATRRALGLRTTAALASLTLIGSAATASLLSTAATAQPTATDAQDAPYTPHWFTVPGVGTEAGRAALAEAGVSVEGITGGTALITAAEDQAAALRAAGYTVTPTANPADAANARVAAVEAARGESDTRADAKDFPAGDEAYHTYDEVNASLRATERAYPNLAKVVTFGTSSEGRTIYGLKISDNVNSDEDEAEVIQTCNVHAREHITTEMCMYMIDEFTSKYSSEERIKNIVDNRVLWFVPMQNPDGAMYDISGGRYQSWRKTRIKNSDGSYGIDPNRNWAYKWGCCNGSSGRPSAFDYRGPSAESAPEVAGVANFVRERNRDVKRIRTHIDWHSYSELILWPFGYTYDDTAPGLDADERDVFSTLGRQMAATNKYTPQQTSDLYVADGSSTDWFWGDQKIWSYTFEMYPNGNGRDGFYPPGSLLPRETKRNREAVLKFLEASDCMWKVTGKEERCTDGPTPTSTPTSTPTVTPTGTPTSTPTVTSTGTPTATPTVTPTATPTGDGSTFSDTTPQDIPDQGSVTASVTSTVARARTVTLNVDLDHGCGTALDITLTGPNGQKYTANESDPGWWWMCKDADNVDVTFDVTGATNGDWTLDVTDVQRWHRGTLNSWSITLK